VDWYRSIPAGNYTVTVSAGLAMDEYQAEIRHGSDLKMVGRGALAVVAHAGIVARHTQNSLILIEDPARIFKPPTVDLDARTIMFERLDEPQS